jgi:thioredoxin-dependent peroxiredoxin
MRLRKPCQSVDFTTNDIYGDPISLDGLSGKPVMLSFFRDAACPFCNFRVYELANNYKEWQAAGLEVVVVFSSTVEEVRQHVARYPRPFRMIADPDLSLYNRYGVEHSSSALLKALLFKVPRIVKGFQTGGRPSNNPHVKIVPADFLLDENGKVVDLWYGRDTADHIPLERIQSFVKQLVMPLAASERRELGQLRIENKKMKQVLAPIIKAAKEKETLKSNRAELNKVQIHNEELADTNRRLQLLRST